MLCVLSTALLAAVVAGAVEAAPEAEPCVDAIGVLTEPLAEPEVCACGVADCALSTVLLVVLRTWLAVLVAPLVTGAVFTCA